MRLAIGRELERYLGVLEDAGHRARYTINHTWNLERVTLEALVWAGEAVTSPGTVVLVLVLFAPWPAAHDAFPWASVPAAVGWVRRVQWEPVLEDADGGPVAADADHGGDSYWYVLPRPTLAGLTLATLHYHPTV